MREGGEPRRGCAQRAISVPFLSWTVFAASSPLRRGVRGAGRPAFLRPRVDVCRTDNDTAADSSPGLPRPRPSSLHGLPSPYRQLPESSHSKLTAGAVGLVVGQPFDVVKVRYQTPSYNGRYTSIHQAFRESARDGCVEWWERPRRRRRAGIVLGRAGKVCGLSAATCWTPKASSQTHTPTLVWVAIVATQVAQGGDYCHSCRDRPDVNGVSRAGHVCLYWHGMSECAQPRAHTNAQAPFCARKAQQDCSRACGRRW